MIKVLKISSSLELSYHFCRRPNANYVCLYLNGQIKKSMSFNLLVTSITLSVGLLAHRAPGERHHEKSWIWNRWKNGKLYLQIDDRSTRWNPKRRWCRTLTTLSSSHGTFQNILDCKLLSDSH